MMAGSLAGKRCTKVISHIATLGGTPEVELHTRQQRNVYVAGTSPRINLAHESPAGPQFDIAAFERNLHVAAEVVKLHIARLGAQIGRPGNVRGGNIAEPDPNLARNPFHAEFRLPALEAQRFGEVAKLQVT